MKAVFIVFCVYVILCVQGSRDYDPDDMSPTRWVLGNMADFMPNAIHHLTEAGVIDPDELEDYIISEVDFDNDEVFPDAYITCAECRAVVGLIKGALNQGNGFDEIRDPAIELCHDFVADEGWDGDIMCEGVIDSFGPHVVYVFNETDMNAQQICRRYNICPEEEAQIYVPPPKLVTRKTTSVKNRKLDDAITLLHLTDMHIDLIYNEGSPNQCELPVCCRDYWPGNGTAGFWGDHKCNLPTHTAEAFMEFLSDMRPDIITYTGDSPPHSVWEETQEGQLAHSEYVANLLDAKFPGVPVFPCIGNHETYPANLYWIARPEIQEFNEEFIRYWDPMARFGPEQEETIRKAGYYTMTIGPRLRVIAYNSNYGYEGNFYNLLLDEGVNEYTEMREWMSDTFAAAREDDEKVLLLGHHPTGNAGSFNFNSRFIKNLTIEYGDIIILHLQGHRHGDNFRMVFDDVTGEARNVQISTTSAGTRTDIDPSARIFYIDRQTYVPLDYVNYRFDIDAAMDTGEAVFDEYYWASEAYGMVDLTPASYADLVNRMEEDQELLELYRDQERTGNRELSPCETSCKIKELCELRTVTYPDYTACREGGLKGTK